MKKYKAIFGNPPFSLMKPSGGATKKLWPLFTESSLDVAEEVYYVTPFIWNPNYPHLTKKLSDRVTDVDIALVKKNFNIGTAVCYWHTNTKDGDIKVKLSDDKIITITKLNDIKYIPFDSINTFSIHKKGWDKQRYIPSKCKRGLDLYYQKDCIMKRRDDEYRYPIFSTNINKLYYTNGEGLRRYGDDLRRTPKIIISTTRNNVPFLDKYGEYMTTNMSYIMVDDIDILEVRMEQLQSNFAKFWFFTGRVENANYDKMVSGGFIYANALKFFPDIPLNLVKNGDINDWIGLDDKEVAIVNKYAKIATEQNERRVDKI